MRSRIIIIIFIAVVCYIIGNTRDKWHGWVFVYDKSGYHLHLPAALIYHDVDKLNFYGYIEEHYEPWGKGDNNYELNKLEGGKRIDRYAIGVAVMESPFFLAAHFINKSFLNYAADGYSLPYEYGAIISNLFWAVLGLFILRRFLLRHFTDTITTLTLLAIAFGTNLYHYVVFNHGMSHPYSFCLFAALLLFTDNLYNRKQAGALLMLGIIMGMIGITRSSNLVLGLIPLLWGINSRQALSERLKFFKDNAAKLLLGFVLFVGVSLIQLGYWKYITGEWFYDAYIDEGFVWLQPEIWKGLFSFRKGWFIYTPIAFIAVLGIYSLHTRFKQHIPAIAVYLLVQIYVVFSWWNWWYGGSFSCRPMVESMVILSLPLAATFQQVALKKNILLKTAATTLLCCFVALNMFQSYQAYKNVIHWDSMTRKYYFRVFLKPNKTAEDEQYLMPDGEKFREMAERRQAALQ